MAVLLRRLRAENAHFRVVTEGGLTSAPADHFDAQLLAQATTDWQPARLIIHETWAHTSEPYAQVGNVMLHARLAALVSEGKLVADRDPGDRASRFRLAD